MKNILWFREIRKTDIPLVGGKGANLGEMVNEAFPVPTGFVVTAQAYFRYIKEKGIQEEIIRKIDEIEVEKTEELERVSKEIRELILRTPMNRMLEGEIKDSYSKMSERKIAFISTREEEYVAVRSSATAEDLPSISEEEHVLLKVNGKPVYDKISEVYGQIGEGKNVCIEVPAMKGNNVEWIKAQSLFRHKANNDKLFKIVTKTGREIVISPNHTLIALDEEKLEPKTLHISEMKKGMKVPVTAFIPELECEETINVKDYVKGEDVTEEKGKIMIKNNSNNWKIQNGLPKEIKVTEDFAYFLGLYVAEGSTYKNNMISVTNLNKKLLNKIEEFLRKLGVYKNSKINKGSVRAYCPSLVRFLHETCGKPLEKKGKGKLCATKKVPNFVFGWNKKNISMFLRGCFDGDGTVSKSEVSYCTISKMLAGGILKLLEILGIEFYINKKINALNIKIAGKDSEKFSKLIGFEHEKKKNRLKDLIKEYNKKEKHPEFKYGLNVSEELAKKIIQEIEKKLPKEEFETVLCKECGNKTEQTSYYKGKKRFFCRKCKKSFYEKDIKKERTEKYVYFDEKGHFIKGMTPWNYGSMKGKHTLNALRKKAKKYGIENMFSIFDGTVKWDEIKEITPIKYDGWVYDFTVPKVENFASGLGGIITHNSASFAGQQETFLNIKGRTEVLEAVKRCWASLFTARAVYYRKKQGFETEQVGIAVVIQKMVDSEVAGIMFTADPTGDTTKIIIESGYGLGEAVVSGSITPDTYTIEKGTMKIIERHISRQEWSIERAGTGNEKRDVPKAKQSKQKIEDKYIVQLAKIGKQIENHYKKPMDIEWALQNKQLYIVQARPITTLKMKERTDKGKIDSSQKPIAKGLPASPGIATGKAVIIPDAKDADKVKEEDIIVTEMTNPDWVPIMEKAKAIITEEGGRTCFTGDTPILTNKGFLEFKEVFEKGEGLYVPSLNKETLKIEWKSILATMKRKGNVIEIGTSQKGNMKGNNLRLTKDHKVLTFDKRKLITKEIQDVIADENMLTIMQNLPCLQQSSEQEKKLAYLLGAISTDGTIYLTERHGEVQFIQKPTPEKESFIKAVHESMETVFGKIFSTQKKKTSSGIIRGKEVIGNANAYRCYSKQIATEMTIQKNQIVETLLQSDEEFILNYLAGIIDGDGSFYRERINIYCSTKELLQSIVVSCLRLGFIPQITNNRTIYNVQIVENIEKILSYTNRVKGNCERKTQGTRFFSAKQLLEDVSDKINYNGRIKPYIKSNLLLDSNKIEKTVLPLCDKKVKEELTKILDSDVRMLRTKLVKEIGETDVYNISVEDNHNYVVFTDRLTPVIVNNCHASIVSRELGIPCVVGVEDAMQKIHDGQEVTVDGYNGVVYAGKVELEKPEEKEEKLFEDKKEIEEIKDELEEEGEKFGKEKEEKLMDHLEELLEERAIKVKVNVALPDAAEKASQTNADGVGLLRAEHMITESGMHPAEFLREGKQEELIQAVKNGIKKVASLFKGKPVWYRTFDARSDEFRNLQGGEKEPEEDNPMIGWHGIRRSLDEPELIKCEFKAIKELVEEGYDNLGVMLPFVISALELKKAKELALEVGLNPRKDVQFGVMIETPASVWIIDELIEEGLDFVSFGTNDLTQLTLGIDRNNEHIQKMFSELHPAILRSCEHVIKKCNKAGVITSICGQAASNEEMVEKLVGFGIKSVSANIDAVENIKRHVLILEKQELLEKLNK